MSTTLKVNILMNGGDNQKAALDYLASKVPVLGLLTNMVDEKRNKGKQAYCGELFSLHEKNVDGKPAVEPAWENTSWVEDIIDAVATAPWDHSNQPIILQIDDEAFGIDVVVVFDTCNKKAWRHDITI